MKTILCIFLLLLTSCASLNLPSNATPQQKHEARCIDAKTAYELSITMLNQSIVSAQAKIYWETYKRGARYVLNSYCPEYLGDEADGENT